MKYIKRFLIKTTLLIISTYQALCMENVLMENEIHSKQCKSVRIIPPSEVDFQNMNQSTVKGSDSLFSKDSIINYSVIDLSKDFQQRFIRLQNIINQKSSIINIISNIEDNDLKTIFISFHILLKHFIAEIPEQLRGFSSEIGIFFSQSNFTFHSEDMLAVPTIRPRAASFDDRTARCSCYFPKNKGKIISFCFDEFRNMKNIFSELMQIIQKTGNRKDIENMTELQSSISTIEFMFEGFLKIINILSFNQRLELLNSSHIDKKLNKTLREIKGKLDILFDQDLQFIFKIDTQNILTSKINKIEKLIEDAVESSHFSIFYQYLQEIEIMKAAQTAFEIINISKQEIEKNDNELNSSPLFDNETSDLTSYLNICLLQLMENKALATRNIREYLKTSDSLIFKNCLQIKNSIEIIENNIYIINLLMIDLNQFQKTHNNLHKDYFNSHTRDEIS